MPLFAPAGGDRVKRHNRQRNLLAVRCDAAGLAPELEKSDLLPPRPEDGGACEAGRPGQSGRRPADVYLPAWGLKGPAALGLAVTSGMRSRKRSHQATDSQCREQGLQFLPIIFEACGGGLGPTAINTIRALAPLAAARSGEQVGIVAEQIQQSLSVCLLRENARAVLRRLPAGEAGGVGGLAEP